MSVPGPDRAEPVELPDEGTLHKTEVMSKRKPKKAIPAREQPESTPELRGVLSKRKKVELVDVLLELAQTDRGVLRQLLARFEVAAAPDELVAATRRAIANATAFDTRDINRNFDYDHQAYSEVKRNLGRLAAAGQLRSAMRLALELMKHGSHQVEMSDEGMMTGEIEDCLSVLLKTLKKCDLPTGEIVAWCSAMLDTDRVGFIARQPLEALRDHVKVAGVK